jgi:hypothetical protein
MMVDIYVSKAKASYGIFVPAGVDPTTLIGSIATEVAKLSPLYHRSTHEVSSVFHGELLEQVQAQISQLGAAIVHAEVAIGPVR